MLVRKQVHFDPSQPVDANIVSRSPHVVVYRMWRKPAGGVYQAPLATGDTQDDIPDRVTLANVSVGETIAIFLAIAGRQIRTPYRAIVTFGQSGALLPGGTLVFEGLTDSNGYAEVWVEVEAI